MTRANPPDIAELIERADSGDRAALWRLYGMAAAWLRDGKPPPSPLAEWIAVRLEGLAVLLRANSDKDPSRTLRDKVLQIVQPSKGGRPPKRSTVIRSRALAQDVLHLVVAEDITPKAACRLVSKRRSNLDTKTVEAAWAEHCKGLAQLSAFRR